MDADTARVAQRRVAQASRLRSPATPSGLATQVNADGREYGTDCPSEFRAAANGAKKGYFPLGSVIRQSAVVLSAAADCGVDRSLPADSGRPQITNGRGRTDLERGFTRKGYRESSCGNGEVHKESSPPRRTGNSILASWLPYAPGRLRIRGHPSHPRSSVFYPWLRPHPVRRRRPPGRLPRS